MTTSTPLRGSTTRTPTTCIPPAPTDNRVAKARMRMSPTGTRDKSPGFTLIELVVVLVGLAVITAAVVPALRGAGHQQDLASAADRVAASARFACEEAIAR